MTGEFSSINDATLARWFSADTIADKQLAEFVSSHSLKQIRPTFSEVSSRLFRVKSPYEYYQRKVLTPPMKYPAHISDKTLDSLNLSNGAVGVEVGSFIGSSAKLFGNSLKNINGLLICVDTWCGDINMWLLDVFADTMDKTDGDPKIFDHFMANIIDNGLTETVIPFRTSSIVAVRTLKTLNYLIDFVYLDSAHECGETYLELSLYYDLIRPGGILFGDDYDFPAVKYDLDLFRSMKSQELFFTGDSNTWMIRKP